MPLYTVTSTQDGNVRMVDARSQAEAMRHVAKTSYVVATPTALEAARLGLEGVVIEEAGVENSAPALQQSDLLEAAETLNPFQ